MFSLYFKVSMQREKPAGAHHSRIVVIHCSWRMNTLTPIPPNIVPIDISQIAKRWKRVSQTERGLSASSQCYNRNVEAPYPSIKSVHYICVCNGYSQQWPRYFCISSKLCRPNGDAVLEQLRLLVGSPGWGLAWEPRYSALLNATCEWTFVRTVVAMVCWVAYSHDWDARYGQPWDLFLVNTATELDKAG